MPTGIEWCEETWNPVTGCTPVSAGCANCYARRMAYRLKGRAGYPADEPFRVTPHPDRLDKPLHWRKPRRVFVCSMGDLFHKDVPDEFVDRVMAIVVDAGRQGQVFLVLTKRPQRMLAYFSEEKQRRHRIAGWAKGNHKRCLADFSSVCLTTWPIQALWLGVSIEDQKTADERIPLLLQTPAAVRFVSYEPALGPVNVGPYLEGQEDHDVVWGRPVGTCVAWTPPLDWVICGGESGPGARPMHPEWARDVRDQCVEAGVPFFFKQWGEWAPEDVTYRADEEASDDEPTPSSNCRYGEFHIGDGAWIESCLCEEGEAAMWRVGKKRAGRLLDGREWSEYPEVKP